MSEYIAFDSHKRYTWMERMDRDTGEVVCRRIEHAPGTIRAALEGSARGTPVAIEATANWYWIVGEIEQAGLVPQLVHPRKAKLMMGLTNKTDRLDAHGMNRLQQNRTLPVVWIPPGRLRDLRELTRTRVALVRQRTRLKNRLLAALAKHGLRIEASDAFGRQAREQWKQCAGRLPEQTRWVVERLLGLVDRLGEEVREIEKRLDQLVEQTAEMGRLMSLPGVGVILAATIALETGQASRFGSPEQFASYAGTTPRVHASGGHVRYGSLREDVNHYLKWAFAEAANSVAVNQRRRPDWHVSRLYLRVRQRKGHAKAVGAVMHHLAESAYQVLRRQELYREPVRERVGTSGV
jgi:transposase